MQSRSLPARLARRTMFVAAKCASDLLQSDDGRRLRLIQAARHLPQGTVRVIAERYFCDTIGYLRPVQSWVSTATGALVWADSNDVIQRAIMVSGVWERTISSLIVHLLSPGDSFVDVGANIGYYTLLAKQRIGNGGYVRAIEASPEIARMLRANLARNSLPADTAVLAAAIDDAAQVEIEPGSRHNLGMTRVRAAAEAPMAGMTMVRGAPVDELAHDVPLEGHLLVKVDIEGTERSAAAGLERLLARGPAEAAVIIEAHPGAPHGRDWLSAMAGRLQMQMFAVSNGSGLEGMYPWRQGTARRIDSLDASEDTDFLLVRGASFQQRLASWQTATGRGKALQ